MTHESKLLRALLLQSSQLAARLFRNQVGQYRLALPDCRRCQQHGRIIRSGLCVGSSDLVGWMPVTIRPEHVGQRLAVFVAIEAKTDTGRLSDAQRAFLQATRHAGAIAAVVRDVADLEMALAAWQSHQP